VLYCGAQSPDAWAILGHHKYMTGDVQEAKNCYERTLSFTDDASEMHSIYLRLASIYLQEAQVSLINLLLFTCEVSLNWMAYFLGFDLQYGTACLLQ